MFRPTASLAMLACGCALLGPATATAQDPAAEVPDIAVSKAQGITTGPPSGRATASSTRRLWATVNICDTAHSPDSMGIRAGVPGNARRHMLMRFKAEYWSRSLQGWAPVGGSGVSPWVDAGPSRHARRQTGWTFEFAPPPAGVTFTMRAVVEFRLRKGRTAVRATETGIPGVDGGDPAGTSKAMCLIY